MTYPCLKALGLAAGIKDTDFLKTHRAQFPKEPAVASFANLIPSRHLYLVIKGIS